jgi:hypothetical protein
VELAIAVALVLAHHADGLQASLLVAADRAPVGGRRVDSDPVMTAVLEQIPGKQTDRLDPSALPWQLPPRKTSILACRYLGACSPTRGSWCQGLLARSGPELIKKRSFPKLMTAPCTSCDCCALSNPGRGGFFKDPTDPV